MGADDDVARRAFVTGANRGLGLHLCRALIARGWAVTGACRDPARAHELAASGPAAVVRFDAADPDAAAGGLVASLVEHGIDGLELCVHNAGIKPAERDPVRRARLLDGLDASIWRDVLDVNLVAPVLATGALLPLLEAARGRATVAMVSSNLGAHAGVVGDDLTYSCSKAALNMAVHLLGRDLPARGVDVVAVSPGWVRTDMGGAGAPLEPDVTMERLAATLGGLDPARSGRFIDVDGQVIEW